METLRQQTGLLDTPGAVDNLAGSADERDLNALEQWLDQRGIARTEQDDPFGGEPVRLRLSQRVLLLRRITATEEYERGLADGEETRRREVNEARLGTALGCALFLWDREMHDVALDMVRHAGFTESDLDSALMAREDPSPDDDDDEGCYGRPGCACHDSLR